MGKVCVEQQQEKITAKYFEKGEKSVELAWITIKQ